MSGQVGRQALKNFFTLLFDGKLSKAEESLKRLQKRYGLTDGYNKALYGIYYSYSTSDEKSFLFQLWRKYLSGEKKEALRSSIRELVENVFSSPRDYLQAWLDLTEMMDSLPIPHKLRESKGKHSEESRS